MARSVSLLWLGGGPEVPEDTGSVSATVVETLLDDGTNAGAEKVLDTVEIADSCESSSPGLCRKALSSVCRVSLFGSFP